MRSSSRGLRAIMSALVATALVALGVIGGVVWGERRAMRSAPAASPGPPVSPAPPGAVAPTGSGASSEPIEVTLTPDAVQRAGIKTAVVQARSIAASISVPGTVSSNAYRETKANALVGGIARSVAVELGATVTRGQPLAVISSTELADAQMKYLSAQAMLAADHQKRERTGKLLAIGAASRQEYEEVAAIHTAHETEVAAARQRLLPLALWSLRGGAGRSAGDIVSEVSVPAPGNGVVIARSANPGQVVSAGQELFTVADLSTVWVIGDLYEKDFAAVRVGSDVTISSAALGTNEVRGRVAYIDPRVEPATRTAKVRVEVPNPGGVLRLGAFVNVTFTRPSSAVAVVPLGAVQSIGERTVVYVAAGDEPRFVERPVSLGPQAGESVQVLAGVKPGERIVTEGSFFLRAEAARSRAGG
jgi:RND family efflux transporter MFP subunit